MSRIADVYLDNNFSFTIWTSFDDSHSNVYSIMGIFKTGNRHFWIIITDIPMVLKRKMEIGRNHLSLQIIQPNIKKIFLLLTLALH